MPEGGDAERLVVLLEARIRDFEKNMKKASGTADRSYDRMRRSSRSATRDMERDMIRSTTRINQALAATSSKIGLFAKSFALGAIGGGSVAGFVSFAHRAVSEMAKLGDVADKIGIGVEALQRLRYGFSLVGVEANTTDMAMQRFARRVADAAAGGGELYKIFKANNVELRDSEGKLRSQVDILKDYANLIKNAGSSQEQLKLAFAAFDSEGTALVSALRNGAAGLDVLMAKTDEAGGVLQRELIDRAGDLDDKFGEAWRNFEINAKRAIVGILPGLQALDDKAKGFLSHLPAAKLYDYFLGDGGSDAGGFAMVQQSERRVKMLSDQVDNLKQLGFDASEAQKELATAKARLEQEVAAAMAGGGTMDLPAIDVTTTKPTVIPPSKSDAKKALDAYESMSKRMVEATDRINAVTEAQSKLNPAVKDFGYAAALAAAKQDLLNAALRAGKKDTPGLREEIDKIAGSYAEARAKAGMLAKAQHEALEDIAVQKDIVRGALDDINRAWEDGKITVQEWGDIALNVLDKVISKIEDDLVDALFDAGNAGGGGGGGFLGSLFGGIGNLLTGNFGTNYFPPAPAAPGFASGTANTGGRRGEPRGIVHGQEAIIPLPKGGKVPVQMMGGGGGGEQPITVDARTYIDAPNADAAGLARIERMIQKRDSELPGKIIKTIHSARIHGVLV